MADPEVPARPSAGRDRRVLAERLLIGAVVLGVVVAGWLTRWTSDDAFITFRVVENLLAGNGPVFSAPVRTEVATSPAWLFLLTGAEAVLPGESVAWASVVLGLAGTATGVLFAVLGARRLFAGTAARLVVPFGAVVLLALPPFSDFTTSGLETGMSFAWLGLSFWGLVRWSGTSARAGRPGWLFVLLGLGPLVRPDFALIAGLLLLWATVVATGPWWRRLLGLVVAGALPIAYQVFRMGYYGLLIPNTAVAKESGRPLWGRGTTYLLDLVLPYALYLPVVLAVAVVALLRPSLRWHRREWSLVGVVVVAAVAHALYVVRVGGDFMHARLLLPGLFLLLCPVAAVPLPRVRFRPTAVAVAGTAAWAVVAASFLRTDYAIRDTESGLADERAHYVSRAGVPHPVTLADHGRAGLLAYAARVAELDEDGADVIVGQVAEARPDTGIVVVAPSHGGVVFAVGNAGFYGAAADLDLVVIDVLGLVDPVNSHIEAGRPRRAGHEKRYPDWYLLARYGADALADERRAGLPSPARIAAAREALSCGAVAELIAATEEPMTWDRFRDNLLGSAQRTALRIPADPHEAVRKFC